MEHYFHLSYDKSSISAKDVAKVLCNEFQAAEIGRPVESTLVFKLDCPPGDIDDLYDKLKELFKNDKDCFVISRVSKIEKPKGSGVYKEYIKILPNKKHEDGFETDIDEMNKDPSYKHMLTNLNASDI